MGQIFYPFNSSFNKKLLVNIHDISYMIETNSTSCQLCLISGAILEIRHSVDDVKNILIHQGLRVSP
jgi:hypothetical protein